ncbi:MAG: family 10 glycosylhydrolase [Paludibacter sp.]|nr:family 10 glycosylhydrolase [Paludibacter sp.]
MKRVTVLLFISITLFSGIFAAHRKREMRAVWIATVANIDWPSQPGLNSAKQRNEMRTMLDSLQAANINAIVIQIRPTADAFYPSVLEPWSHWLTGKQGIRPTDYYDPLKFIIEEAHKRCIEVHAWLNPYRVTNSDELSLLSKNHLFYKQRDLFVRYGGKYYFDPGLDETREFLNRVVQDIVERYDIDAIHFDDYFYPYKVAGQDFPDDASFKKFPRGYAPNQKNEWRRNNVNMVIRKLQETIKSAKPWVEFGISPFGVWRNNDVDPRGSATKAGVQNYDDLYADILKWLQEGSIDYVTPQLYWEIGKKVADYSILLKWWSENTYGKNLFIGLYASQLGNKKAAPAWTRGNELIRQIRLNQQYPQVDGAMFFSASTFLKNRQGLIDSLKCNLYKYPAICPVNKNIQGDTPAQPQNIRTLKDGDNAYLVWDGIDEDGGCKITYYIVYAFKGKHVGDLNDAENIVARTTDTCIDLRELDKRFKGNYTFVVTAVNRYKHESIPTMGVIRKL